MFNGSLYLYAISLSLHPLSGDGPFKMVTFPGRSHDPLREGGGWGGKEADAVTRFIACRTRAMNPLRFVVSRALTPLPAFRVRESLSLLLSRLRCRWPRSRRFGT